MTMTAPPAVSAHAATDAAERRQPRWVWPALSALLATTALLYLWGLGSSGWANTYLSLIHI